MSTEGRRSRRQVLVLWQGERGKAYADAVHKAVEDHPPEFGLSVKLVSQDRVCLERQIYEGVRRDIAASSAAVAVIARDERRASEAGNVWLEIGLWCSLRSSRRLLVCMEKDEGVAAASDVLGRVTPGFANAAELREHVQRFLFDIFVDPAAEGDGWAFAERYPDHQKVKDTILNRHPDGSPTVEAVIGCSRHGDECPHREELFYLTSELLRMGRANREHAAIQSHLRTIAASCFVLAECMRLPEMYGLPAARSAYYPRLRQAVEALQKTAQQLLGRHDRADRMHTDPWERISEYFSYRIQLAAGYAPARNRSRISPGALARGLDEFLTWARRVVEDPDYEQEVRRTSVADGHESSVYTQLSECGDYADCFSDVLDCFGEDYFRLCRKAITQGLGRIVDPGSIPEGIKAVRANLPHNRAKSKLPTVWPRPDGGASR